MTLTVRRDPAELRTGLARWLGRPVHSLDHPAPGWSCETLIIDGSLVVRLPPAGDGIFPVYDLATQAAVQAAAGAAGVPVAAPVQYEPDPSFLGAPFIAMPFAHGPIPAEFTPADPWLAGLPDDRARHSVWRAFLDAVAAIHGVEPPPGLRVGLDAEVAFWEEYVDWATDGSPPPALADAMAWCGRTRPATQARDGLLWGDVRLGNVVWDPTSLRPCAVLDWDMTSVGPIEMDLAWFLALDGVATELTGMAVPGFGTQDEAAAVVEAAVGRALGDLGWFEIFALVRASAVSTRIAILFERAGQRSMFKAGQDPTLAAATRRIEEWPCG